MSRGSSDRQTAHPQVGTGTPVEVPVPRNVTTTEESLAARDLVGDGPRRRDGVGSARDRASYDESVRPRSNGRGGCGDTRLVVARRGSARGANAGDDERPLRVRAAGLIAADGFTRLTEWYAAARFGGHDANEKGVAELAAKLAIRTGGAGHTGTAPRSGA